MARLPNNASGIGISIPYGTELYEVSGVEFCEWEDKLDLSAKYPDEALAADWITYRYLNSLGYTVSEPNRKELAPLTLKGAKKKQQIESRKQQIISRDTRKNRSKKRKFVKDDRVNQKDDLAWLDESWEAFKKLGWAITVFIFTIWLCVWFMFAVIAYESKANYKTPSVGTKYIKPKIETVQDGEHDQDVDKRIHKIDNRSLEGNRRRALLEETRRVSSEKAIRKTLKATMDGVEKIMKQLDRDYPANY